MTTNTPLRCANSVMSAFPGSSGKQVVLLNSGNYPGFSNFLNETWTFNGSGTPNWTDQSVSLINSTGPLPGRINATMAYDGYNVMMFGGQGAENSVGVLNDTWIWSGTAWTQKGGVGLPLASPFGRFGMQSAHLNTIGGGGGVVMFGGENLVYNLLETWIWDGGLQTWTQLTVANGAGPAARTGHVMASDGTNVVMFGGQGTNQQFNDTWVYTTSSGWTKLSPATSPSVRSGAVLAYDSTNSKFVLFGGHNEYNYLDETWTFTIGSGTWTQVTVANGVGPSGRIGAQMAFDAAGATTIMFGGYSASDSYASDSTWSFDGSALTWTKL